MLVVVDVDVVLFDDVLAVVFEVVVVVRVVVVDVDV